MFFGKMLMDYSLFFLLTILDKTAEGHTCKSKDVVTLGHKLKETGFVTFHQIKLMECARKCMVRNKCKSFNYERNSKICELNSENKTTTTIIKASGYLYGEPSDWPTELIGACAGVNCPKNSMCIELIKGHVCVKSDCDDPPSRTHAYVNSGCSVIGCRRTHACISGYVLTGDAVAVCGSNGEWTHPAFECTGCPALTDLPNAALRANTSLAIGSTLVYECNHGYIMSGSGTVTCQRNATWSQVKFKCHEAINVALKREATQSSTYKDHHASNGVDWDNECTTVAKTAEGDTNRWWSVNFGQMAVVEGTSIANTANGCYKQLANISVWVGTSLDTMELCSYYEGPGVMGEPVKFNCSSPMTGQYLNLTGGGSDKTCIAGEYLRFCEIKVMGYFPDPLQCGAGQIECHTKLCIANNKHCNQINDCGDWSDEDGCQ